VSETVLKSKTYQTISSRLQVSDGQKLHLSLIFIAIWFDRVKIELLPSVL